MKSNKNNNGLVSESMNLFYSIAKLHKKILPYP